MEPGDGLRQDQPRLQALLRRAHGTAARRRWGSPTTRNGFELTLQPQMLELPLRWRSAEADLRQLDERPVPRGRAARVHPAGRSTSCAARTGTSSRCSPSAPSGCLSLDRELDWPPNVWMGVSVENRSIRFTASTTCARHARAREVPVARTAARTACRTSICDGIDWVIVGGESGPRPARCIRRGSRHPRSVRPRRRAVLLQAMGRSVQEPTGRELEGRTWDEMPNVERIG